MKGNGKKEKGKRKEERKEKREEERQRKGKKEPDLQTIYIRLLTNNTHNMPGPSRNVNGHFK